MRFATELLLQHKAAVGQQAVNAVVAAGTADEYPPAQYNRAIIGYYKLLLSL